MILKINGTDFSNYIQQKVDIIETPRYIDGVNSGVSINGTAIWDRIATKYDPTFRLKPLPQSMINTLVSILEEEVTIEYTSFLDDETRTIQAMGTSSQIRFIKDENGTLIYGEATISFEEK